MASISDQWQVVFEYRRPGPEWDAARREQYLLRPDVERPLGVDRAVWPEGGEGDVLVAIRADPSESLDPSFVSLGFDVADAALTSGLNNCGYWPDELARLRPLWRDRLNEHGLLVSREAAEEFRVLTDARVVEHAPFFVFELLASPQPR